MTQTVKEKIVNATEEIRALLNEWAEAHRIKDADRIQSLCADDTVEFIMAPPLQYSGANPFDRKKWLSSFEGLVGYEIHDLKIAAGEDTAFCHFLNHLSATPVGSGKFAMWNRCTLGFRKINGRWLITHVHSSVPFYMDGGFKAAVDLKP